MAINRDVFMAELVKRGIVKDTDADGEPSLSEQLDGLGVVKAATNPVTGGIELTAGGVPVEVGGVSVSKYKLLPKTASKIARIRAGVTSGTNGLDGQLKVGILGDSTTTGAGAGTGGVTAITGARAKTVGVALANILTAQGISSRHSTFMGDQYVFGNAGGTYPPYDPRVSLATAAIVGNANFRSAGGIYFRLGTGGSLTFDPGIAWDTAVIYTVDDGAAIANITLGNAASILTGSATFTNVVGVDPLPQANLKSLTITIAKATTSLIITRAASGGNPDIRGVWLYDSTTPAVNVFGLGAFGLRLANEAQATLSCPYTKAIASDLYDLLFVDMSINDMGAGLTPVATYITALTAVVEAQKATGGDVIVCTPNCCNPANVPLYVEYLAAIKAYCATAGVLLIDSWDEQGSYAVTNANGLMYDSLHPTAAGYADKAQRFAKAILNA